MESHQVTELLEKVRLGDKSRLNEIYSILYQDIKKIAGYQLKLLKTGETITPTVLAHECFIKLHQAKNISIQNKRHFMKCLARSMRSYLIDSLRAKVSKKRQGILKKNYI
ncbi:MAG: ECF-type sigma factor [Proteobacteria bacterium]|nr:ECF-type sigma factor [Pseudomonadota bacterium]